MTQFEQYISTILTTLKSSYGEELLNTLTMQLHNIIGADYTFIARIDAKRHVSTTISLVAKGDIAENFEYSLQSTPCADVSDDSVCMYPQGICQRFPDDQLLFDMEIEGYVGTPLHDSSGKVMGLIVALFENEIADTQFVANLFELLSGRIAAEIERSDKVKELYELNHNLEERVATRTQELSEALAHLKESQDKLIEQEKMASLGNLVAGVAHEINTPLGVAVLSASNIQEIIRKLKKQFESNTLSKSALATALNDIESCEESLSYNLNRAAQLVQNFKQVAVERNIDELRTIELKPWLDSLCSSLRPIMKKQAISLSLWVDDETLTIESYPSKLSQVLTNLITNAITHGFPKEFNCTSKAINVTVSSIGEMVNFTIHDNGVGIDNAIIDKIYDPFFTTNRQGGNTGLGLSIVSNIVRGNLHGQIQLTNNQHVGTEFTISLPKHLKA
ncbi:sensor histidine kinase [Thalassotalea ganghwensis]